MSQSKVLNPAEAKGDDVGRDDHDDTEPNEFPWSPYAFEISCGCWKSDNGDDELEGMGSTKVLQPERSSTYLNDIRLYPSCGQECPREP